MFILEMPAFVMPFKTLVNTMMKSDVNIFDAQEVKPYENHLEILPMRFRNGSISKESKFGVPKNPEVMDDALICDHVDILLKKELNVLEGDLRQLVLSLISASHIHGRIHGRIDEDGLLELDENERYYMIEADLGWAGLLIK
ncbi:hypothetical protein BUALT_Bualt07G0044300 [Buddleja alternifolia]|uniref:Uncharacterized protein n=1 Tax=Buddleja alternifolia TaxID=168488 RepID=A0AAV6XIQ4_9LAMI|nr:hypothetical protein BUALT_Bualt07G0044300 [Buddleja alternifolia]